ncbi:Hemin transport system permease protein HmuU [Candidatus Magnetaquicoccaceae bacterium FCR-1]|uniref:Hemin transport system permease protein HmuU n=2 Tax=Candidatus Magnetaquiglobus chichijimensis TaxID=3141448 RepID=A0ABQ0C7G2_9PROT
MAWLPFLLFGAVVVFVAGLSFGGIGGGMAGIRDWLMGNGDPLFGRIVLELRLPRVAGAMAVGGLLALSGVLMQVLMRNPLADPYVLGLSGGAACGAILALAIGASGVWVDGGAWLGALVSMLVVLGLAGGPSGWEGGARLLLTGVVVASGWGAGVSFLLYLLPDERLRGALFWLMGDLGRGGDVWVLVGMLGVLLAVTWPLGRALNLLATGVERAASLGVAVKPLKMGLYLVASLAAATAVAAVGSIGFVGLVTPHLLRLAGCVDHRCLLPASVLLGGMLLTLADLLARTLIAPQQMPAGVLTALLGAPLFVWLLRRSGR